MFGCPHRAQPGPRGKGEACLVAWFSCWACIARFSKQPRAWLAGNARIGSFSRARLSAARGRTGGSEARARGDGGRWKSGAPSRRQISLTPFHSLTHSHCPPFFPTASPPAAAAISDLRYRRRRRKRRRRLRRIWCSPCCWPPSGRPSLCHGSPYAVLVSDAGKQHPLPPLLAQWLGR